MKYEGQQFANVPEDTPVWFRAFLSHYAAVVRFLIQFNITKFTMGTDVNVGPAQKKVVLRHGVIANISHGLKLTPTRTLVTGRVVATKVLDVDSTTVRLIPRLISTGILTDLSSTPKITIEVEDATLFEVGDVVIIGKSEYTIKQLSGNTATFSKAIPHGTISRMTLARDNAELTIF